MRVDVRRQTVTSVDPTDARKAIVRRFCRSDRRALRQLEGSRLRSAARLSSIAENVGAPSGRGAVAGIAPASLTPQVVLLHETCVEHGCQWLHYVCRDAALRELVAGWHLLTLTVREEIMEVVRGAT